MFGVGSVELLILSILPIVVVFVLLPTLYLVIKWTVSSALRGVSSVFREASAGDHTARQILDERYARGRYAGDDTPGTIRRGRYARSESGREESTSRLAGTYRRSERRLEVFRAPWHRPSAPPFGTAVKAY